MIRKIAGLIATVFALLFSFSAIADSWAPAQIKSYFSTDKTIRVIVTPREIEHALAYFSDKVDGKEPAGQKLGGQDNANIVLEKLGPDGKWSIIWQRPLLNDVAPVEALVSKSGKFVVTFDNWHSTGYGDNVVVIYGADGDLVRSMQLTDFLPNELIQALPASTSSLHWSGRHVITDDETKLILKVRVPGGEGFFDQAEYFDVSIDLPTGAPLPIASDKLAMAISASEAVNADRRKQNEERRQYLTQPLLGPSVNEETEWHKYLDEAFLRLTNDWRVDFTSTTVLRLPTAKDYNPSKKWVRAQLRSVYGDNVAFASLSQPNLISVLRAEVSKIKPGKLAHLTIYLALDDAHWNEAVAIFKTSGAKLVQLDPSKPIPQNPERLEHLMEGYDDRNEPLLTPHLLRAPSLHARSDPHRLAIFGDGSPRDVEAFVFQQIDQRIVRKNVVCRLCVDQRLDRRFHRLGRGAIAVC